MYTHSWYLELSGHIRLDNMEDPLVSVCRDSVVFSWTPVILGDRDPGRQNWPIAK